MLTTNLPGNVTYLNQVAEMMTGWSSENARGRPLAEVFRIIDGETRQPAPNPAQRAIDENRTVGLAADSVLLCRDGRELAIEDSAAPIHNRDGQVAGAVIVFHDVSESRAIGLARGHDNRVSLMFLDIDYFKHINDSLGYAIGDQLLQAVAECLKVCIRDADTVCRQGGDEFASLRRKCELCAPTHRRWRPV